MRPVVIGSRPSGIKRRRSAVKRTTATPRRMSADVWPCKTEGEVAEKYRTSGLLCLPHSYRAVELATPSVVLLLAETQIAKLDALLHDLAEYLRKVDYRLADEPKGEEQTAWQRAVRCFVGEGE
jgi:hypothetical protein